MVQVKHYVGSPPAASLKAARAENAKVARLGLERYILATSSTMTPMLKDKLIAAMPNAPLAREDVLGQEKLYQPRERESILTEFALRNLKPRTALYKIADRDGMYVAVSPVGTISFRYDYRANGRRETLTIGRYGRGGISLALARKNCCTPVVPSVRAGRRP